MEHANEKQIGLGELAEEDLANMCGGNTIDEQMAEARDNAKRAMSAAATQLMLGIVAGAVAATSAAGSSHVYGSYIGKHH